MGISKQLEKEVVQIINIIQKEKVDALKKSESIVAVSTFEAGTDPDYFISRVNKKFEEYGITKKLLTSAQLSKGQDAAQRASATAASPVPSSDAPPAAPSSSTPPVSTPNAERKPAPEAKPLILRQYQQHSDSAPSHENLWQEFIDEVGLMKGNSLLSRTALNLIMETISAQNVTDDKKIPGAIAELANKMEALKNQFPQFKDKDFQEKFEALHEKLSKHVPRSVSQAKLNK